MQYDYEVQECIYWYINEWLKKINKKSCLITNILTMFASQSSDWHLEYQMSNDYDEQKVEYTQSRTTLKVSYRMENIPIHEC